MSTKREASQSPSFAKRPAKRIDAAVHKEANILTDDEHHTHDKPVNDSLVAPQSPAERTDMAVHKAPNILTDDEHHACDQEVNELLVGSEALHFVLGLIVEESPPKANLDNAYSKAGLCAKLLKGHAFIGDCLRDCLISRSYKEVRNLAILRKQAAVVPDNSTNQTEVQEDIKGKEATVKAWDIDFSGSAQLLLYSRMQKSSKIDNKNYARFLSIVQSSGMGKSRTVDELAKDHLVVPINLRQGTTGFPPPDVAVRDWWLEGTTQQDAHHRAHAFLFALFETLKAYVESIDEHIRTARSTPYESPSSLDTIPAKFRFLMRAGQTFDSPGATRIKFYDEVLDNATKLLQIVKVPKTPPTTATKFLPKTPSAPAAKSSETMKTPSPTRPVVFKRDNEPDRQEGDELQAAADDLMGVLLNEKLGPQKLETLDPQVILAFDEAHVITQPTPTDVGITLIHRDHPSWSRYIELRRALRYIRGYPCFSLFLSTTGSMHQFSPPAHQETSNRLNSLKLTIPAPFCELGFDQLVEALTDENMTLDYVSTEAFMASLGRPLFASRYKSGDKDVKSQIISFASQKLLCAVPDKEKEISSDGKLACMSVRYALQFTATSLDARERERKLVERHMRVCLAVDKDFETATTIAPSEPLLAEAAANMMRSEHFDVPGSLLREMTQPGLDKGERGELIAIQILLAARDLTVEDAKDDRAFKVVDFITRLFAGSGTQLVLQSLPARCHSSHSSIPLKEQFGDSWMHFNHFVKVHDYGVVNQEFLWLFLVRGAAIVCRNNQRGFDIIIPVCHKGKEICKENTTAILIQVKNDGTFGATFKVGLFDKMDPYARKVFTKASKSRPEAESTLLPIIRLVFALASDEAAISFYQVPERKNPPREGDTRKPDGYTSYDIWCAQASSDTFGVIQDKDNGVYKSLLKTCSQAPEVYSGGDDRAKVRQSMSPCTAPDNSHWSWFKTA